ncbi:MAG: sigma-70 family RNA polymerase sigma factor [Planctomycetota bacterium]
MGAQGRDAGREVALPGCVYPQTTSASMAMHLVGKVTSPSQAAERAEMIDRVESAIGEMDPVDQEILALRHFEELANSEAAEALGITEKAASIRYVRAIRRLKDILSRVPGLMEKNGDA